MGGSVQWKVPASGLGNQYARPEGQLWVLILVGSCFGSQIGPHFSAILL